MIGTSRPTIPTSGSPAGRPNSARNSPRRAIASEQRREIHPQRDDLDLVRIGDAHLRQIGFQRRAEGDDPVGDPGQGAFDPAEEALERPGKISAQDMAVEGVDDHRHSRAAGGGAPDGSGFGGMGVDHVRLPFAEDPQELEEGDQIRRPEVRRQGRHAFRPDSLFLRQIMHSGFAASLAAGDQPRREPVAGQPRRQFDDVRGRPADVQARDDDGNPQRSVGCHAHG